MLRFLIRLLVFIAFYCTCQNACAQVNVYEMTDTMSAYSQYDAEIMEGFTEINGEEVFYRPIVVDEIDKHGNRVEDHNMMVYVDVDLYKYIGRMFTYKGYLYLASTDQRLHDDVDRICTQYFMPIDGKYISLSHERTLTFKRNLLSSELDAVIFITKEVNSWNIYDNRRYKRMIAKTQRQIRKYMEKNPVSSISYD